MSYETILLRKGIISILTLNTPANRNSLGLTLMEEVLGALEQVKADPDSRVVLLNGNGPDFCSGHDLSVFASMGEKPGVQEWEQVMDLLWERWYSKWWDFPKPVVAAVQGRAYAGGAELVMLADIAVAAEDARFGYGVIRSWGGVVPSFLLPYVVGMKKAAEWYLTGAVFDAKEAERFGLVNKVVPRERLQEEAMNYARAMSEIRPEALRLNKLVLRNVYDLMGLQSNMRLAHKMDAILHSYPADSEILEIMRTRGVKAWLQAKDRPR